MRTCEIWTLPAPTLLGKLDLLRQSWRLNKARQDPKKRRVALDGIVEGNQSRCVWHELARGISRSKEQDIGMPQTKRRFPSSAVLPPLKRERYECFDVPLKQVSRILSVTSTSGQVLDEVSELRAKIKAGPSRQTSRSLRPNVSTKTCRSDRVRCWRYFLVPRIAGCRT